MNQAPRLPARQVRANFDDETLTVYQAYLSAIAVPAVAAQTLVSPFKLDRMTWIKPSFCWMMYRSGWARKPGQEHVLAIRITRSGFETALSRASLSHFDPDVHDSHDQWLASKQTSPVRIQWDPERDIHLRPLPWRSIQIGLSGSAVVEYVQDWIVGIDDITDQVRQMETAPTGAALPEERGYPLPRTIAAAVGATG